LSFRMNGIGIYPNNIQDVSIQKQKINSIYHFELDCLEQNTLQVIMTDKNNDDLLYEKNSFVDHYVKIREFEVDNIKAQKALHRCSKFTHTMDDSWVQMMRDKGIYILPVYERSPDLRLNGVMELRFNMPFWQWQIENGYE